MGPSGKDRYCGDECRQEARDRTNRLSKLRTNRQMDRNNELGVAVYPQQQTDYDRYLRREIW